MDNSLRKITNKRTQPAKIPGFSRGIVIPRRVVNQVAPAIRELWSNSSDIANIIDAIFLCPYGKNRVI